MKRLRLLLLFVVLLALTPTTVLAATVGATTLADPSSASTWRKWGLENSTENVGRIWTDKTVSDGDIELTGAGGTMTIKKGNSDFLTALSPVRIPPGFAAATGHPTVMKFRVSRPITGFLSSRAPLPSTVLNGGCTCQGAVCTASIRNASPFVPQAPCARVRKARCISIMAPASAMDRATAPAPGGFLSASQGWDRIWTLRQGILATVRCSNAIIAEPCSKKVNPPRALRPALREPCAQDHAMKW